MLQIEDLHVSVNGQSILKGLNLALKPGETHAIMGPNGSGKSTLAYVLAGKPGYEVTKGRVLFENKDLLQMAPEERARAGVFLSFQHPIEVPGVRLDQFIRAGYNAVRKSHGHEELDPLKFDRLLKQKAKIVDLDPAMAKRSVNQGFSGGEKKRNEILQMAILEPKLSILDEPDSGLDVDALRIVAEGINQLKGPDKSILLVTHYQRILNYITPDHVHVFVDGRVVASGGAELAHQLEADGYEAFIPAAVGGESA